MNLRGGVLIRWIWGIGQFSFADTVIKFLILDLRFGDWNGFRFRFGFGERFEGAES